MSDIDREKLNVISKQNYRFSTCYCVRAIMFHRKICTDFKFNYSKRVVLVYLCNWENVHVRDRCSLNIHRYMSKCVSSIWFHTWNVSHSFEVELMGAILLNSINIAITWINFYPPDVCLILIIDHDHAVNEFIHKSLHIMSFHCRNKNSNRNSICVSKCLIAIVHSSHFPCLFLHFSVINKKTIIEKNYSLIEHFYCFLFSFSLL